MNSPIRPIDLALPRNHTPVSTTEMWLGMCATLVVMTLVGLWFVGVL